MKIVRESIDLLRLQEDCESFKGLVGPFVDGACCLSGSCCQGGSCCQSC